MENSVCCLFDGRGFPGNRGSAAVLFGSQSRIFFKYLGEITLIFKADGKSDVKNRPVRGGKKFFAFLDADRIQIFFEGRTAGLLEERRKVGGVQLHMVGSFFQGKRSVIMLFHIGDGVFYRICSLTIIRSFRFLSPVLSGCLGHGTA